MLQERLLKKLKTTDKSIKLIGICNSTVDMKDFVSYEELEELTVINEGVIFVVYETSYFVVKIVTPEDYEKKVSYQQKENEKKQKHNKLMTLNVGINSQENDLIRILLKAYNFCKKEKQQVKLVIKSKYTRQNVEKRKERIYQLLDDSGLVIKEEHEGFLIVYTK